jgi:dephospho-CoA kinase
VERLVARDGIPEAYARSRIRAQKSEDWFRSMCDHTLYNDGTRREFQDRCAAFLDELLK